MSVVVAYGWLIKKVKILLVCTISNYYTESGVCWCLRWRRQSLARSHKFDAVSPFTAQRSSYMLQLLSIQQFGGRVFYGCGVNATGIYDDATFTSLPSHAPRAIRDSYGCSFIVNCEHVFTQYVSYHVHDV